MIIELLGNLAALVLIGLLLGGFLFFIAAIMAKGD